jgi:hypothetical protein
MDYGGHDYGGGGGEGEELSMRDILFQFIPYYGQGNISNDSTVRAALSSLSIQDIDSRDDSGNTLLLLACMYRCEDLVRIMLNKGADPNAINSSGACCLHFACYGDTASMIIAKGLLQNGANPEVQETTYGCTPLHYCASNGNVEFCKLLLSHGAIINTVDYYNYTCVDYARQTGMADAAVYLQQRMDKYTMQYQYGNQFNHYGGAHGGMLGSPMSSFRMPNQGMNSPSRNSASDWSPHIDPSSGATYYVNSTTNETLWEYDWKLRMQQSSQQSFGPPSQQQSQFHQQQHAGGSGLNAVRATGNQSNHPTNHGSTATDESMVSKQTARACLIDFFSQHDNNRVGDVDSMLGQYAGHEMQLLKELCNKYSVNEKQEMKKFQQKFKEIQQQAYKAKENTASNESDGKPKASGFWKGLTISTKSAPEPAPAAAGAAGNPTGRPPPSPTNRARTTTSGFDANYVNNILAEERAKIEQKMIDERNEFRRILKEKDDEMNAVNSELAVATKKRDELKVCFHSCFMSSVSW